MPIQNEADLLFCAAMIVLGIAVLRARALPTGNWIPLVIGLLSVLSGPANLLSFSQQGMGIVWALTWGSNTGVEGANRAVALGLIGRVLSLYVLLAVGSWFALGFALWRDGSANVGAPVPTSTHPTTPARPSGPTQPAAAAQPTALTAPAADDQPFEARLAQAYLEGYRAAQHQGTGTPFRAHPSPAVADLAALGGRLASALAAPGSAAAVVASLAALASGATLIAAYVFHLGLPRQDAIIFAMFCGTVALFAAAPSLAPALGAPARSRPRRPGRHARRYACRRLPGAASIL